MKKLLLLMIVLPFGLISKAQIYSGNTAFVSTSYNTLSIDTIVLRDGSKSCKHYYQSATAEQEMKSLQYAVMTIKNCLPQEEDRLICTKCLRHLKVIYNNECVTVLPYSELLKKIEAADKKNQQ